MELAQRAESACAYPPYGRLIEVEGSPAADRLIHPLIAAWIVSLGRRATTAVASEASGPRLVIGFVDLREGDALETLADIDGAVDFVLLDTWTPLALPPLKLLTPRIRTAAIVMCDNIRQFAKACRPYTDHVRDADNGFRSMLWSGQGGIERSVRDH